MTVPPVPLDISMYSYATDNAVVLIPSACNKVYGKQLGTKSIDDRQPGGPKGMGYFRVSDSRTQYSVLASMSKCSCGLVLLMHGMGGVVWESVSYAVDMSAMGYVVVLPDSQAMPTSMGLKGAGPFLNISAINTSNYCGAFNPYVGSCNSWSKPYCYSMRAPAILLDPNHHREYFERVYLLRKLELDYFVKSRGDLLGAWKKVFLAGRNEGAMVAGRYYNSVLFAKLSGLILVGWSCEFNHFVSCAESAKVCGDRCQKSLPQLNLVGGIDQFYGPTATSVASTVAAASNGYGGPITGNCRAAYNAQGFGHATVVVFPGVWSYLTYSVDNAVRSLFADFLANPADSSSWGSLKRANCSISNGVYSCDGDSGGKRPCFTPPDGDYFDNPDAPWKSSGATEHCA